MGKEELDKVLADRGKKYGEFDEMSNAICALQRVMVQYDNNKMEDFQYHGMGMIMVKLGRIMTGDPNYDDNWRDIAGYATKVMETLAKPEPIVLRKSDFD